MPFVFRLSKRFWVGVQPMVNHEFSRSETSMMLGGEFGFKVSDRVSFALNYAEHVAGTENLQGMLSVGLGWGF